MRHDASARRLRNATLAFGALVFVLATQRAVSQEKQASPSAGGAVTIEVTSTPADDLHKHIEAKTEEIKRLEGEAQQYRTTLEGLEREANTFQSRIKALDTAIKRLDASIRVTNAKIERTNLEIAALGEGIREQETAIEVQRRRIGELVALIAEREREPPLIILVKHESVSAFFAALEGLLGVERNLLAVLEELRAHREELKARKHQAEAKQLELAALAEELADQKSLQIEERRERSTLLAETKNQERRYQELLAEVERKREALQQEINALEADLSADFDRAALPAPGRGVLGWPLERLAFESCWRGTIVDKLANCVTQFFGNTDFARAGGYRGQGHNGVDFRAAAGTPILATERGTVRATGDTDAACRRASYGKWVLIDHPTRLATLYAHLLLVKVRPGDPVNRGELIGYSGRTGYATGPHLHFGVFARQAVSVGELRSRVCGRMMTLPLAPFGGYLNPLDYL